MFKEIKIGAVEVPMCATASTSYRYKQIFHEDILNRAGEGLTDADAYDIGHKLAFVMAMQGERLDMNLVNADQFYGWLDQFEPDDIVNALDEIMELYRQNTKSMSTPKKKGARR